MLFDNQLEKMPIFYQTKPVETSILLNR